MARQKQSETCPQCGAPRWKTYPLCQQHQRERWRRNKGGSAEKSAPADFSQITGDRVLLIDEANQQAWRVIAVEQHAVGRVLNSNTIGILEHQGYQVMRVIAKGKGNESAG